MNWAHTHHCTSLVPFSLFFAMLVYDSPIIHAHQGPLVQCVCARAKGPHQGKGGMGDTTLYKTEFQGYIVVGL